MQTCSRSLVALTVAALLAPPAWSRSGENTVTQAAPATARTVVVAIVADRNGARVVGWDLKQRAPLARLEDVAAGEGTLLEVTLHSAAGSQTRRVNLPGLCLDHDPATPHHEIVDEQAGLVAGSSDDARPRHVVVHHDGFLVEFPAPEGPARVEVWNASAGPRAALGVDDVDFRNPPPALATTGKVYWPEDFGETQRYRVVGNEAEIGTRLNIVVVPDGYRHSEKALLDQHFNNLVSLFNSTTPYQEHASFLNYILVYAYSEESGTDQCDCGVVVDTAMNTRFPERTTGCGATGNRCLYYGTANGGPNCDETTSDANILAAELRAPAHDTTIIPVNTARGGGCGG